MRAVSDEAKREALAHLADLERREAALFAERALALAGVRDLWSGQDDPTRPYLALEVAVACQIAQVTASNRMAQARRLVEDLPRTLQGLQAAVLTVGQAIVLLEETKGLAGELVQQLDRSVRDSITGLTAGDTRRLVKIRLIELDALAAEARRQAQAAARRIWTSGRPDGRAFLGAELSAEQAGTCWRALTELTTATLDPLDPRSLDQQRADLFSHLPEFALTHLNAYGAFLRDRDETGVRDGLSDGSPATVAARRARVQAVILIPVETALDLSDNPSELLGYGPVSGAHARELLTLAQVRKACIDAHTGRILTLEHPIPLPTPVPRRAQRAQRPPGTTSSSKTRPNPQREATGRPNDDTCRQAAAQAAALAGVIAQMASTPSHLQDHTSARHDPNRELAEPLRLRDPRCTGPGCAAPSHTCDLDHAIPWPQGPTNADNLGPLSRRCHRAKTHSNWHIQPHPNGTVTWTSPLGMTWTSPPRHHPPDLTAFTRPRLVWPRRVIEIDQLPHAA